MSMLTANFSAYLHVAQYVHGSYVDGWSFGLSDAWAKEANRDWTPSPIPQAVPITIHGDSENQFTALGLVKDGNILDFKKRIEDASKLHLPVFREEPLTVCTGHDSIQSWKYEGQVEDKDCNEYLRYILWNIGADCKWPYTKQMRGKR
jgi:hypothetical protein